MKFLIEHHQNTIRIGYKEITILQSWNTRLDADSAIRSSGYSLSGARGTWIRFVLVQIGTRRLGTRSGLACQLARVPRIRDALGFSHRIPGTSAPAYTRREWARARLMNYCADLERLCSFLPVRSRARGMKSRRRNTPAIRRWDPASTKATLCAPTVRASYFAKPNSGRKFREEISLEAFNPVIFYPARKAACSLVGGFFLKIVCVERREKI